MANRSVLADIRDAFSSELDAGQQSALISVISALSHGSLFDKLEP